MRVVKWHDSEEDSDGAWVHLRSGANFDSDCLHCNNQKRSLWVYWYTSSETVQKKSRRKKASFREQSQSKFAPDRKQSERQLRTSTVQMNLRPRWHSDSTSPRAGRSRQMQPVKCSCHFTFLVQVQTQGSSESWRTRPQTMLNCFQVAFLHCNEIDYRVAQALGPMRRYAYKKCKTVGWVEGVKSFIV